MSNNHNSYFFLSVDKNTKNSAVIEALCEFAESEKQQTYVINTPLGDSKYSYSYSECLVVLSPHHKILFIDCGDDSDGAYEFQEDFLEDLGSISDKYQYKGFIGRPRVWREENVYELVLSNEVGSISNLLAETKLIDPMQKKRSELLISLLTGSINDITRVKADIPNNILDRIKQKIQLFDADQTKFIYNEPSSKTVAIQGLSGTGKTELLLHKLKDIYINQVDSRVLFTCHNKILADSLRKRIPDFFDFMKVEKQIEWDRRLWCVHAWGSTNDYTSGAYRYICHKYNIPFYTFSYQMPFSKACQLAIDALSTLDINSIGYAFDYVLIDESQDFPKEFIDLCSRVTLKTVYVAGDIFQSIFDKSIISSISPDYLLSKCYRTDPKTLMFAHGIGMGLFEEKKLRWLQDEEWKACGYSIEKYDNDKTYILKREPLRRFEDIDQSDLHSTQIIRVKSDQENNINDTIMSIIRNIIAENPTVQPDDIGIIFIGSNKAGYDLANTLEYKLAKDFGWQLNKAYESKEKLKNKVFISNQNNVKGLEFPFVICISWYISDLLNERNALYMMLSRSFIQSYLVASDYGDDKLNLIEGGLNWINDNNSLRVTVPSEEEQKGINTSIDYSGDQQSLYDLLNNIFDELNVPPLWREPLTGLIRNINYSQLDHQQIKDLVSKTFSTMMPHTS